MKSVAHKLILYFW